MTVRKFLGVLLIVIGAFVIFFAGSCALTLGLFVMFDGFHLRSLTAFWLPLSIAAVGGFLVWAGNYFLYHKPPEDPANKGGPPTSPA